MTLTNTATFSLLDTLRGDTCYEGRATLGLFLKRYCFEAGFKYITWMRITTWCYERGKLCFPLYAVSRTILKHFGYKYSFDISYRAKIGKGFQIAHFGYIVIPRGTVIGENCRVRPGVVIGRKDVIGEGSPRGNVIGSHVEFGVGCKVMGPVTIGDDVVIGANAVVTKDIPSNSVVAGIPARVLHPLYEEKRDNENGLR